MTPTLLGRRGIVGALLLAVVAVLVAALATPAAADTTQQHTPRQGTLVWAPADDVIEHTCENFGSTVQGYRAGHCVEFRSFVNSAGRWAVRAGGQAFCQQASGGQIVRCAGIDHTAVIFDWTIEQGWSADFTCGRFGSGACPAGRATVLTPGMLCVRGHEYTAAVNTKISLPVSGSNTPLEALSSAVYVGNCV